MSPLVINNPTVQDVIFELINELGFSVTEEHYLKFQSGEQIKFNGKNVRYSFDTTFLLDDTDVWFDPINNLEIIKNLYNYYIVDLYHQSRIKVLSTKEMRERTSHKMQLIINYLDENENEKYIVETMFYNNINLAYIQFILRDVLTVECLDNK